MASAVDPTSSRRNLSSPWSHVVRGEHEPITVAPSSPSASPITSPELPGRSPRKTSADAESPLSSVDHGGSGNASDAAPVTQGKKLAWNFPSNDAIETGSVMDTISWPALSESAKASPKSSSSDSLKTVSDGSVVIAPGSVTTSPSSKQASNYQNPNSAQNILSPSSHNSMKRGAGGSSNISSSGASGASNAERAMPSFLTVSEPSHVMAGNQPSSEPSPKGSPNKNNCNNNSDRDHGSKPAVFSPQSYGGNEHHRGYGGGRRGNHGNKRDEWTHRNFGRDVHMQQPYQQPGVRSYARPPAVVAAPFIAPPPPLRPFSNHMGFPDFPSPMYFVAAPLPESLRGVPFAPQPPPAPQVMFFPAPDPQRAMLLKQIDYYFSPENLCKDIYLRQNMDQNGWVPISLVAGFNRVKQLANNLQYILDTVQLSSVVEVQDEKIRKRNDWMSWLLHPADHLGSTSSLQSPTSYDGIAAQFHNVCLDAQHAPKNTGLKGSAQNEVGLTRSASGNLNSHLSVVRDSKEDDDIQFSNSDLWNVRNLVRSDTL